MDGDRQPIFNAPWPAVLLTVVILTVYGVQSFLPAEQILPRWAFSAQALEQGRYVTLFSALFLSGGWGHALANGVGALAFGTPLARLFGGKFAGASAFFLFCLVCGALSNLGFALVHPGSVGLLVGASGSVSALMAAALSSLWLFYLNQGQILFLVVILTILIYIRHAANLKRLNAGTEPKIGAKKG
ncbi:glycerol-3-phosphate acyltransferase [mine drainage metagenome]|uniref:Glycerol-3-phosphate acyltransferase n=1 Tax=mine drainage metagenome TaxID=410659 RepID=A0A1J5PQF5_9ZZZZ